MSPDNDTPKPEPEKEKQPTPEEKEFIPEDKKPKVFPPIRRILEAAKEDEDRRLRFD